jgi:hypothetical protein
VTKNRLAILLGTLVLLCSFAFPLIHAALAKPAVPAAEEHPEMQAALRSLQDARKHLEKAGHDFGGHRQAALNHVDAAIEEMHAAFKVNS